VADLRHGNRILGRDIFLANTLRQQLANFSHLLIVQLRKYVLEPARHCAVTYSIGDILTTRGPTKVVRIHTAQMAVPA
jgi:hypothetical protein